MFALRTMLTIIICSLCLLAGQTSANCACLRRGTMVFLLFNVVRRCKVFPCAEVLLTYIRRWSHAENNQSNRIWTLFEQTLMLLSIIAFVSMRSNTFDVSSRSCDDRLRNYIKKKGTKNFWSPNAKNCLASFWILVLWQLTTVLLSNFSFLGWTHTHVQIVPNTFLRFEYIYFL